MIRSDTVLIQRVPEKPGNEFYTQSDAELPALVVQGQGCMDVAALPQGGASDRWRGRNFRCRRRVVYESTRATDYRHITSQSPGDRLPVSSRNRPPSSLLAAYEREKSRVAQSQSIHSNRHFNNVVCFWTARRQRVSRPGARRFLFCLSRRELHTTFIYVYITRARLQPPRRQPADSPTLSPSSVLLFLSLFLSLHHCWN